MNRKSKKDVQKEIEEGLLYGIKDIINEERQEQLRTVDWEKVCKEAKRKAHVQNMSDWKKYILNDGSYDWEMYILNDGSIDGPTYKKGDFSLLNRKKFIVLTVPLWHVSEFGYGFSVTDSDGNEKEGYVWQYDKWVKEEEAIDICMFEHYSTWSDIVYNNIDGGYDI